MECSLLPLPRPSWGGGRQPRSPLPRRRPSAAWQCLSRIMCAPLKGHGLGAGRPGLESSSRRQLCALDRLPLPRRLTLLLCKPEVSPSPLEGAWDVWQVLGVSLLSGWPGPVTGNYPRATQTPCCQEETGVFFPSPRDTCRPVGTCA